MSNKLLFSLEIAMSTLSSIFSHPLSHVLKVPDGIPGSISPPKKWWEIDSLDPADIVDVWSFDADTGNELVGELNGRTFIIAEGSPSIQPGLGFYLGGGGLSKVPLPAGLSTQSYRS